jgi:hypothetical protein
MEQSYKRVNTELEVKKHAGGVLMDQNETGNTNTFYPTNTDSTGIRSRGTRGIMEGLRDILGSEVIDVKPIEIDPNSVVNARDKKLIDDKFRPQDDDEDQSDFIIEDDIIE